MAPRVLLLLLLFLTGTNNAFQSITVVPRSRCSTCLTATTGGGGKKKKKKRRRKNPPPTTATPPPPVVVETTTVAPNNVTDVVVDPPKSQEDLDLLNQVANFEFTSNPDLLQGIQDDNTVGVTTTDETSSSSSDESIPLPDIRQARKRKQEQEEQEKLEEEREAQRVRIKRSDKEAFTKVRYIHSLSHTHHVVAPRTTTLCGCG